MRWAWIVVAFGCAVPRGALPETVDGIRNDASIDASDSGFDARMDASNDSGLDAEADADDSGFDAEADAPDSGDACTPTDWFADEDDDGFGAGAPIASCLAIAGRVQRDGDCDDTCPECNPDFPLELCDGLDNDCDTDIDSGCRTCFVQTAASGEYLFCDESSWDFDEASAFCSGLGLELVKVESRAEDDALWSIIDPLNRDMWMGASESSEGTWDWGDGTRMATSCTSGSCSCTGYCNWVGGQPNSSGLECLQYRSSNGGGWSDAPCGTSRGLICEFP